VATRRLSPQFTLGSSINIALAIVLLGAAMRLWDKLAEMQVAQADARGDIKVLAEQLVSMKDDLADLKDQLEGDRDAKGK
jgi:hypothetical protein